MHLKYSKGSKQLVQRYIALQAVEPNSLIRSVWVESHLGHATIGESPSNAALPVGALPTGGAIPYSFNFNRAVGDIQSLVQAGLNTSFIVTLS